MAANNIRSLGAKGYQTVIDDERSKPGASKLKLIKQFKPPQAKKKKGHDVDGKDISWT